MNLVRRTDYRRILRNQHATGAATAINGQGPVLYHEPWAHTTPDTTNVWVTAVSASGSVSQEVSGRRACCLLNCAAATEFARLQGRRICTLPGAADPSKDIYQRIVLEWEAQLGTLANQDNDRFGMGLLDSAGTPDSFGPDSVGFILQSGALNAVTNAGGAKTLTVVANAPTLTNINRYRVVVRNGKAELYVNDVLAATHTTNIPNKTVAPFFLSYSNGGGSSFLRLGAIRCYLDDAA